MAACGRCRPDLNERDGTEKILLNPCKAKSSFSIAAEVKALPYAMPIPLPRKLCVRLTSLHGARASLRGRRGAAFMMGVRRVERFNLSGFLAAESGRICCPCELAPPIVPVSKKSAPRQEIRRIGEPLGFSLSPGRQMLSAVRANGLTLLGIISTLVGFLVAGGILCKVLICS